MTDAMAIAATAMRAAENRVSAAAEQIVRAVSVSPAAPVTPADGSPAPSYQTVHLAMPTADLVEGMIDLKQAELSFREGIVIFKAADEMTRRTLDILT
ncbi:MAG TPA: hypothetical protein VG891_07035 [Rhizomicrobium sp.]|jgi:flagellar basal body rod protein FlgC|nr:hypothetical protein [Rhizomicrobium sp.]